MNSRRYFHDPAFRALSQWVVAASMAVLGLARAGPDSATDFRLVAERIEIPERGTVPALAVLSGDHKFSLIPPHDWSQASRPKEKTITFTTRDLQGVLSFRVYEEKSHPGAWKKRVLEQFPEAKIRSQFPCYAGGQSGMAFDLERTFSHGSKLATRVALVPFCHGMIEFQMTTTPSKLERYHFTFGCLLNSLEIQEWPPPKPLAAR